MPGKFQSNSWTKPTLNCIGLPTFEQPCKFILRIFYGTVTLKRWCLFIKHCIFQL